MHILIKSTLVERDIDLLKKINQQSRGRETAIDFVIFGNVTIKMGRQKEYLKKTLQKQSPVLLVRYEEIFPENSRWGVGPATVNIIQEIIDTGTCAIFERLL